MAKVTGMTQPALEHLLLEKEAEIPRLPHEVAQLKKEVEGLKALQLKQKTEQIQSQASEAPAQKIHLTEEANARARAWLGRKLQIEVCGGLEIWTTVDRKWIGVLPTDNAGRQWISRALRARHSAGIEGNVWKNTGMWMKI